MDDEEGRVIVEEQLRKEIRGVSDSTRGTWSAAGEEGRRDHAAHI